MSEHVVLLSIPGLRGDDLPHMRNLQQLVGGGDAAPLVPSFPAVTCPVEVNMTTGLLPAEHGVVANGFYWRDRHEVEMWTASASVVEQPQLWDLLHEHDASCVSAVWFLRLAKGGSADVICQEAPIHQPDGSESLSCFTRPDSLYDELVTTLDHFPLQHFWGPVANIQSTKWIVDSAIITARRWQPNFFLIYLPHLDYASQKFGPHSPQAQAAAVELDEQIGQLVSGFAAAYSDARPLWLVASEYTIVPVDAPLFPNRQLREKGWLVVTDQGDGERLDLVSSSAWALVDHQFAHVFVRGRDEGLIGQIVDLFRKTPGVASVLAGEERARFGLDHSRSGDVILIADRSRWFAYYWWFDDGRAAPFAHTVDIHQKPGYDPVELFFDPAEGRIPIDATLVRGSHGAPAVDDDQRGVLLSSARGVFVERALADTDVADIVLRQFGV